MAGPLGSTTIRGVLLSDGRPTLCTLAKSRYRSIADHELDLKTHRALAPHFRRLWLIGQSIDERMRISHASNIVAVGLPRARGRLIDHVRYVCGAVRLGLEIHRRYRVDLWSASEPTGAGLAAVPLKWLTRRPLLVQIQGDTIDIPPAEARLARRWLSRAITRFVAMRADRVRCVSQLLERKLKALGIPPERLDVLPPRCDVRLFDPLARRQDGIVLRRDMGLERGAVVLFVGNLVRWKGVSVLIEAFAQVRAERDVRLVLVGSGDDENELRRQTARAGVEARVIFAGRQPHHRIPAFLAAADVFVLPSLDEGLPRAGIEAMAMCVPVIATRVGGLPELIRHGETGWLVEARQPRALAEAVTSVLANPELALEVGRRAREEVVARFEFERSMERYRDMLYRTAGR